MCHVYHSGHSPDDTHWDWTVAVPLSGVLSFPSTGSAWTGVGAAAAAVEVAELAAGVASAGLLSTLGCNGPIIPVIGISRAVWTTRGQIHRLQNVLERRSTAEATCCLEDCSNLFHVQTNPNITVEAYIIRYDGDSVPPTGNDKICNLWNDPSNGFRYTEMWMLQLIFPFHFQWDA